MNQLRTAQEYQAAYFRNVPLLEYRTPGFNIVGYSRGAVQTLWHISEFDLLIDVGANSWDTAAAANLAVTHGHPDHLSGVVSYLSTRQIMKWRPPRIFISKYYSENLRQMLDCWSKLSNESFPVEIIECAAGDRMNLKRNFFLRPFDSVHVLPTQGYLVEEDRQKLLPELVNATQSELVELKRNGASITETETFPVFAFCGDTQIEVLDRNPQLYEVETLVLECTFVDESVSNLHAGKYGHIHIDSIVERAELFKNKILVLSHFSTRWTRRQIIEALEQRIPDCLRERVVLWI
jgi:ribonuclease Z